MKWEGVKKLVGKNMEIRKEFLQSVSGLSDEQLNELVEQDSWTIMQVLHHLYLIEISVTHIISSQLAKGEQKIVEEKPIQSTTNRSTKIKAPSFSIPSTNFIII